MAVICDTSVVYDLWSGFSHDWLSNYTSPKHKRGDQSRDLADASG